MILRPDFNAKSDMIIACENEALCPEVKSYHDAYKGVFSYYEFRGIPLTKEEINGVYTYLYSVIVSPSGVRGITNGNRIDLYKDMQDRREYISSLFKDGQGRMSPTLLHYCMSPLGEFKLDSPHLRLIYNIMYYLSKTNSYACPITEENLERLHDVYCYIRAEELMGVTPKNLLACNLKEVSKDSNAELPRIVAQIKNNTNRRGEKFTGLMPVYKSTPIGYRWNTCSATIYEYFSYMLVKPAKAVYYYRPKNLLLKLLAARLLNKSMTEIDYLEKQGALFTEPFFYKGLTLATENQMLPYFVDGSFDRIDGCMSSHLQRYNENVINASYSNGLSLYANIYTEFIVQKAESIMGMLIYNLYEEYHRKTGDTKHENLRVLNVTPGCLILEVNPECNLYDLLPESHQLFTRTRGCSVDAFINKIV